MNYGYLAYPDMPENAVHLLPLGAVEPHGPHAPLGTDTLISVGMCHRAAERLEGEIPVSSCRPCPSASRATRAAFAGTVWISEDTLSSSTS